MHRWGDEGAHAELVLWPAVVRSSQARLELEDALIPLQVNKDQTLSACVSRHRMASPRLADWKWKRLGGGWANGVVEGADHAAVVYSFDPEQRQAGWDVGGDPGGQMCRKKIKINTHRDERVQAFQPAHLTPPLITTHFYVFGSPGQCMEFHSEDNEMKEIFFNIFKYMYMCL